MRKRKSRGGSWGRVRGELLVSVLWFLLPLTAHSTQIRTCKWLLATSPGFGSPLIAGIRAFIAFALSLSHIHIRLALNCISPSAVFVYLTYFLPIPAQFLLPNYYHTSPPLSL